jgi:hypothetical protein
MPIENENNEYNEELEGKELDGEFDEYEDVDDISDDDVNDTDFSSFVSKDVKRNLDNIFKKVVKKKRRKKKRVSSMPKMKISVPDDRAVIIEKVSKAIIDNQKDKQFGWYNGEKLKVMVFTFNNDSAVDFNFSLFDPSMPLDYFMTTGQDLNNKITIAGSSVQYSDVLFNILANPTLIVQGKFTISGPVVDQQINEALQFEDKDITGTVRIFPFQTLNLIDAMQVQRDIIMFDMQKQLPFTYIPDGVDVVNYKVYAGMTVTFAFYYKQISLKEILFKKEMSQKPGNQGGEF